MDLADLPALAPKIERLLAHHNALRRGHDLAEIDGAAIYDDLAAIAPKVLPYMDSVWSLLDAKRREGKRILFEGAQGALLDIDHGTYPYVTSSNTVAAQAATGIGLGPERHRLRARHLQGLHHAGGRGAVPDRPDGQRDRQDAGRARPRIRHRHRPRPPLRLVRRRAGAPDRAAPAASTASRSPSSTFSTASTRSRSASATGSTAATSTICPAGERAQARVEPVYETIEGWKEPTARRALLGAIAGAGDKICAPNRGTGRLPGGAAVDQPGARGHHPDEESVRGMIARKKSRSSVTLKSQWLIIIR